MAEVCWKDIIWTGADKELGIKELLTVLKGYGSLEVLHFENPSKYKGELSVWLDEQGLKHISLFHLEVLGEKRKGLGREMIQCLRKIFGGDVYVQDPGEIPVDVLHRGQTGYRLGAESVRRSREPDCVSLGGQDPQ